MNALHLIRRAGTRKLFLLPALVAVAALLAGIHAADSQAWSAGGSSGGMKTIYWNDGSTTSAYARCHGRQWNDDPATLNPYSWTSGAIDGATYGGPSFYSYPPSYVEFAFYRPNGTLWVYDANWIRIPKTPFGINWEEGGPTSSGTVTVKATFWHNGEQTPWLTIANLTFAYDAMGRLQCTFTG